jgi:hypothetical protein
VNAPRRFRHVNGFVDGTDYVQLEDGKAWAINKSGFATDLGDRTKYVLEYVEEGTWVEIEVGK